MMMMINQYPYFCISSYTTRTNINKDKQENLEMIAFQPLFQLMITSKIIKPSPSPQPYTSLQGKRIHMYSFDIAH